MSDATLAITVDGTTHTVRLSDLCALDAKDFRANVGIPLTHAMTGENTDLDVVAGLVWLARRKIERALTYATVATAMNYDTVLAIGEPSDGEVADDPGEA